MVSTVKLLALLLVLLVNPPWLETTDNCECVEGKLRKMIKSDIFVTHLFWRAVTTGLGYVSLHHDVSRAYDMQSEILSFRVIQTVITL